MPTQVRRRSVKGAPRARKVTGALAPFADAKKQGGKLLPLVERFLLKQHLAGEDDLERRQDIIHPSEMAKSDWCPRATYYRIVWTAEGRKLPVEKWRFQRENIFYEGDRIHDKWQANLWAMGVLWGRWKCLHCITYFWGQSPRVCEKCGSPALRYAEVPMQSAAHLLGGQGDGETRIKDSCLFVEVKSVGDGTVRIESPTAFRKHNHKVIEKGTDKESTYFDMRGLFRDIRHPFPSHFRQVLIYLFLRDLKTQNEDWPECEGCVIIYEAKSTQATKEFFVKRDNSLIEDLLSECLDIVYALENDRVPACKVGRRSSCPECEPFINPKKDDSDSGTAAHEERPTGLPGGEDQGDSGSGEEEPRAGRAATGSGTRVARRSDRPQRRVPDEPHGRVHTLGGLLPESTGDGRGRRSRR